MSNAFTNRALAGSAFVAILLSASGSVYAQSGSVYLAVGNDTASGVVGFGGQNPYQYGDGGEFTAVITGWNGDGTTSLPAGYAANALYTLQPGLSGGYSGSDRNYVGAVGFETFCLEDQVNFYVGETDYTYTTGFSLAGQVGTGVNNMPSLTTLSVGAAWLYQQFATDGNFGGLANYNYSDAAARLADAGQFQSAIWYLENETGDPYVASPVSDDVAVNSYLAAAESRFGGLAAAQTAATNLSQSFGVEVLNLTSSNGTIAQAQLVYTGRAASVPDATSSLVLFGAALLGLAGFRRSTAVVA